MDGVGNSTPILEKPQTPAAILALGDLVWRVVAWLGNFDFIMSMREERIAMIFESLLNWGWLVILGWAILRFIRSRSNTNKKFLEWEMIAYVALVAFMAGVLLAVQAAGGMPRVLVAWGGTLDGCTAAVDTSRLVGYVDKYKIAVICGVEDSTVDQYEDTRIAVSSARTITGATVAVTIPYKGTAMEGVAALGTPTDHWVFLFPKDEEVASVKKLSDIKKYGGIPLWQK
jgi:hypothetical protein